MTLTLTTLQVDGWNTWFSDQAWSGQGKNQMDVGQLWLGFLDFFARWNDREEVVSIRQSRLLTKEEKEWSSTFPCIAIEDPFEVSRNLAAGLTEESESLGYENTSDIINTILLLAVSSYIKETFAKTRDQYKTPPDMNLGLLQVSVCLCVCFRNICLTIIFTKETDRDLTGCPPNRLDTGELNK